MIDNDKEDYSVTPSPAVTQIEEYRYLIIEITYDQDPLNSWKENETKYSDVSWLAKNHSSIVASSVPRERLFSEAGTIIKKKKIK